MPRGPDNPKGEVKIAASSHRFDHRVRPRTLVQAAHPVLKVVLTQHEHVVGAQILGHPGLLRVLDGDPGLPHVGRPGCRHADLANGSTAQDHDPIPPGRAGLAHRPATDRQGFDQGPFFEAQARRETEESRGVSGRELGKTSVRILRNPLALPAVVVVAAPAVAAAAAVREALDGDPVSRLESLDPLPQLNHDAGGLVPQRQSLGLGPVAAVGVKVASADAGLPGIDGDESGRRRKPLHLLQTDSPDSPDRWRLS